MWLLESEGHGVSGPLLLLASVALGNLLYLSELVTSSLNWG